MFFTTPDDAQEEIRKAFEEELLSGHSLSWGTPFRSFVVSGTNIPSPALEDHCRRLLHLQKPSRLISLVNRHRKSLLQDVPRNKGGGLRWFGLEPAEDGRREFILLVLRVVGNSISPPLKMPEVAPPDAIKSFTLQSTNMVKCINKFFTKTGAMKSAAAKSKKNAEVMQQMMTAAGCTTGPPLPFHLAHAALHPPPKETNIKSNLNDFLDALHEIQSVKFLAHMSPTKQFNPPMELLRRAYEAFSDGKSYSDFMEDLQVLLSDIIADVLHPPYEVASTTSTLKIDHVINPEKAFWVMVQLHFLPNARDCDFTPPVAAAPETLERCYVRNKENWQSYSFWNCFKILIINQKCNAYVENMDPLGQFDSELQHIDHVLPKNSPDWEDDPDPKQREKHDPYRAYIFGEFGFGIKHPSQVELESFLKDDMELSRVVRNELSKAQRECLFSTGGASPSDSEKQRRLEWAVSKFMERPSWPAFSFLACVTRPVLELPMEAKEDDTELGRTGLTWRDEIRIFIAHFAHRNFVGGTSVLDTIYLYKLYVLCRGGCPRRVSSPYHFDLRGRLPFNFRRFFVPEELEDECSHLYDLLADSDKRVGLGFALQKNTGSMDMNKHATERLHAFIRDGMLREDQLRILIGWYPKLGQSLQFLKLPQGIRQLERPQRRFVRSRTEEEKNALNTLRELLHDAARDGGLLYHRNAGLAEIVDKARSIQAAIEKITPHDWGYRYVYSSPYLASHPFKLMHLVMCSPSNGTVNDAVLEVLLELMWDAVDFNDIELTDLKHPLYPDWSYPPEALEEFVIAHRGGLNGDQRRQQGWSLLETPIVQWGKLIARAARSHDGVLPLAISWPQVSPALKEAVEEGGLLYLKSDNSRKNTHKITFVCPFSHNVLYWNTRYGDNGGVVVKVYLIEGFVSCRGSSIECENRTKLAELTTPCEGAEGQLWIYVQSKRSNKRFANSFASMLLNAPTQSQEIFEKYGLPVLRELNKAEDGAFIIPGLEPVGNMSLSERLQSLQKKIHQRAEKLDAEELNEEDTELSRIRIERMASIVDAFLLAHQSQLPCELVGLILKVFSQGLLARGDDKAVGRLLPRFTPPQIDQKMKDAHDKSIGRWIKASMEQCRPINFIGPEGPIACLNVDAEATHVDEDEDEWNFQEHDPGFVDLAGGPDQVEEQVKIVEAAQELLSSYKHGGDALGKRGTNEEESFIKAVGDAMQHRAGDVPRRLYGALVLCDHYGVPLPVVYMLLALLVIVLTDGGDLDGLRREPSRLIVLFSGRDLHSQGMGDPEFVCAMMASILTYNESGFLTSCMNCGKKLLDAVSARLGLGPDCIKSYPSMHAKQKELLREQRKTKKRRLVRVGPVEDGTSVLGKRERDTNEEEAGRGAVVPDPRALPH